MFALLGNEKIPQVHNIGMMGVYMNQFPFDLDRPVTKLILQFARTSVPRLTPTEPAIH